MTEFKILVEGFATKTEDGWLASPNTVLIEDSGKKILVDPGMDQKALKEAFSKNNLSFDDIDLIFLTHRHSDHILNIRLFPDTDFCDPTDFVKGQKIFDCPDKIPDTSIQIIQTPGHIDQHASLLIDTEKGKVCIAGDLFWWTTDQEQKTDIHSLMHPKKSYATNEKLLLENRKKILGIADWIIPGHGKMFKVERQ